MITSFGGAGTRATRGPERHAPTGSAEPAAAPPSLAPARSPPRRTIARCPLARAHTNSPHTVEQREQPRIIWAFLRFRASWPRAADPRSPAARPREAPASRSGRSARPRRHRHSPRRHSCHTDRLRAWRERHEARRRSRTEKQDTVIVLDRGNRASAARTEIRTHPDRAVGAGGGAALRPPIERDHGHQCDSDRGSRLILARLKPAFTRYAKIE